MIEVGQVCGLRKEKARSVAHRCWEGSPAAGLTPRWGERLVRGARFEAVLPTAEEHSISSQQRDEGLTGTREETQDMERRT